MKSLIPRLLPVFQECVNSRAKKLARTAPILFPKTGCERGAFQRVYKFTGFIGLYSIHNQCITIQFIVDFGGAS